MTSNRVVRHIPGVHPIRGTVYRKDNYWMAAVTNTRPPGGIYAFSRFYLSAWPEAVDFCTQAVAMARLRLQEQEAEEE
jgi:hypothetical protein